jgi:hypothetical protein
MENGGEPESALPAEDRLGTASYIGVPRQQCGNAAETPEHHSRVQLAQPGSIEVFPAAHAITTGETGKPVTPDERRGAFADVIRSRVPLARELKNDLG